MKDGPVLFYCKDGELYPVAMTEKQQKLFELSCLTFHPLKVVMSLPQGKVKNLKEGKVEV